MRSRAASLLPRLAEATVRRGTAAPAAAVTAVAASSVAAAAGSSRNASTSTSTSSTDSSSRRPFSAAFAFAALFAGTAAAAHAAAAPAPPPAPKTTTIPADAPTRPAAPLFSRLARDVEQRLSGLTADEVATVRLFEQAAPSVVAVTNLRTFRFFRLALEDVPVGTGSGFVFDSKGRVITNYHVVRGATHVSVTLLDGTELKAEVLGVDPERDIAVVQLKPFVSLEAAAAAAGGAAAADDDDDDEGGDGDDNNSSNANTNNKAAASKSKWRRHPAAPASRPSPPPAGTLPPLTPVTIGSSSKLLVGQRVYAIGAPLGLDHTFSSGIVSALGRQIPGGDGDTIQSGIIQTDASGVNPGSSGGPLLDSRGRTVGVLCAIADPSGKGSNAGIAFAIPIDAVVGVAKQIIAHGRVVRPSLGVAVAPGSFARRLTGGDVDGVLLLQVPAGSPAAEAGLRGCGPGGGGGGGGGVGDIIVAVDGRDTPDVADLTEALDDCAAGQVVEVEIARYFPPLPSEMQQPQKQPPPPQEEKQQQQQQRKGGGAAAAGGVVSGGGGGIAPGGEWRWATARVKLGERGVAGSVE
jgi:S1-C subfamily serine protease